MRGRRCHGFLFDFHSTPHLEEIFGALDLEVLVLVLGHIDVDVFPPMFHVDQALQKIYNE